MSAERTPDAIIADLRSYYNVPVGGRGGWPYVREAADCIAVLAAEIASLRGRSVCVDCGSPMVAHCSGCQAMVG